MYNSMNPYGGVNPLIDKMIGNAYDIVKYVAKYLKEIRYVAENMQYVYAAANGSRLRYAVAGTGAAQLLIPLGPDFPHASIEGLSVVAVYNNTTLSFPGSNTFTYSIVGSNIVIDITSTDPAVTMAEFRATATYLSAT